MNNITYVNEAIRTEAPVTPEMVERFMSDAGRDLIIGLQDVANLATRLDFLKKFLIYNKSNYADQGKILMRNCDVANRIERKIRLLHAVLGLITEVGEISQAVVDSIVSKSVSLDYINLIEEMGDVFWYLAIMADDSIVTFDDIEQRNIAKLRARYPDKFTEGHAIRRDLVGERKVLQNVSRHMKLFNGLIASLESASGTLNIMYGSLCGAEMSWGYPDGLVLASSNSKLVREDCGIDMIDFTKEDFQRLCSNQISPK